jgi:hypothetical protein
VIDTYLYILLCIQFLYTHTHTPPTHTLHTHVQAYSLILRTHVHPPPSHTPINLLHWTVEYYCGYYYRQLCDLVCYSDSYTQTLHRRLSSSIWSSIVYTTVNSNFNFVCTTVYSHFNSLAYCKINYKFNIKFLVQ